MQRYIVARWKNAMDGDEDNEDSCPACGSSISCRCREEDADEEIEDTKIDRYLDNAERARDMRAERGERT